MFILSSLEEKHRVVDLFIVVVLHSNKQNTTLRTARDCVKQFKSSVKQVKDWEYSDIL